MWTDGNKTNFKKYTFLQLQTVNIVKLGIVISSHSLSLSLYVSVCLCLSLSLSLSLSLRVLAKMDLTMV